MLIPTVTSIVFLAFALVPPTLSENSTAPSGRSMDDGGPNAPNAPKSPRSRSRSSDSGSGSRESRRHRDEYARKSDGKRCDRNRKYRIEEIRDFDKYKSSLACIYKSGKAPNKVPEGTLQGTVLHMLGSDWFNGFANSIWGGKMILKTICNGKSAYVGWNNVGNAPTSPFTARLGNLNENLAKGEARDNKETLIMDYTKDFRRVCPEFRSIGKSTDMMHNAFQLNQLIMVMRIVGEKSDGSTIYLGKAYSRETNGDKKVSTVAYFSVVNYDPKISSQGHHDDIEEESHELPGASKKAVPDLV